VRTLRALFSRFIAVFRRDRLDRDFATELETHLALHIEDNIRAGMTPADARRHALMRLGGVRQAEQLHRERRGLPVLETLPRDIRFGARLLRRTPGFTAVAIATLGVGIAANTVIFSFVNTMLFRPLPVDRPGELVTLNRSGSYPTHSYPDYRDLRDRNTVLSGLAAFRFSPMSLETAGAPARIWGFLATGNYFDVVGIRAAVGGTFTADDDRTPGGHPVAVISHACWQTRFGGDPAIAGRAVTINGAAFTILGVMPAGFRGTELFFTPDVWVPMAMQARIEPGNPWLERRSTHNIFLVGRLREGVARAQAEAGLNIIAEQLGREHPSINEGVRITLSPPGVPGSVRGAFMAFSAALFGIAALVLLLACTNLTGILLARAADRQRQTAVCLALGAPRSHLIRQSLVESGLLCAAATAAAILMTIWVAAMINAWRPPVDVPLSAALVVDYRVLSFSLALAVAATLLVGLAPAFHGTGPDLVGALKRDRQRRVRWQMRDVVVAGQIALSAVLLTGSVLVVRSLREAVRVDVGFNPRGAVSLRVDLALQGYDEARGREFQRLLRERVAALPGIESASIANSLPLSLDHSTTTIHPEGEPVARGARARRAAYYQVSPGFFRTMQTRLVAGRDFDERDAREAPSVAIVNEAFVRQLLGGGQALGRRYGRPERWTEIVGVVQDGRYQSLGEDPKPVVFAPIAQWYNSTTTVVARASVTEREALDLLRREVRAIDPALSIFEDGSLSQLLALPMFPLRMAAGALGAFGVLAIVLVSIGTYALVSYSVARRMREICIRLAIGASTAHIVRIVVGRTAVIFGAGASAGLFLAFVGVPLLSPLLLGVAPRDPRAFGVAVLVLLLVTAAACWRPTRRALTGDPATVLRSE
jgi:predicted permease